jgi:ribosome modulation factor
MHLDDESRERARAAISRLQAVLTGLASDVALRIHERCPYRDRQDRCTFAGGCRNQRSEPDPDDRVMRCGGDHQLRRLER